LWIFGKAAAFPMSFETFRRAIWKKRLRSCDADIRQLVYKDEGHSIMGIRKNWCRLSKGGNRWDHGKARNLSRILSRAFGMGKSVIIGHIDLRLPIEIAVLQFCARPRDAEILDGGKRMNCRREAFSVYTVLSSGN
jgi:hypothetical protein